MKINFFLLSNVYISHCDTFLSEYIGYVFYLLSSSYNYNKFLVLKKNNVDLILLSNERYFYSDIFHIYREKYLKTGFFFFFSYSSIFNHSNFLNFSLFIQYRFFSQLEWRYIRNFFFRLSFNMTLIHSNFFDLYLRHKNVFFSLSNFLRGHNLLIHSSSISLNVFSFFFSLYNLFVFLIRSRDMDDYFSLSPFFINENNYFFSHIHDSHFTDVEIDIHFDVETQLTLSGFFFYGSVFPFDSIFFFSKLSFFSYYSFLPSFFFFFRIYIYIFFFSVFFFFSFFFFSHYFFFFYIFSFFFFL